MELSSSSSLEDLVSPSVKWIYSSNICQHYRCDNITVITNKWLISSRFLLIRDWVEAAVLCRSPTTWQQMTLRSSVELLNKLSLKSVQSTTASSGDCWIREQHVHFGDGLAATQVLIQSFQMTLTNNSWAKAAMETRFPADQWSLLFPCLTARVNVVWIQGNCRYGAPSA